MLSLFTATFLQAASLVQASAVCSLPPMPQPHSNNAVAALQIDGRSHAFSFLGLKPGKSHGDISKEAWLLAEGADGRAAWSRLPDVPVAEGRLAATAQIAGGKIYLFGGYTVAADGAETSTPEVFEFDPSTRSYTRKADIPLPVDDTVSAVYRDRYIYLISGWHDIGNLFYVQVYDTAQDSWDRATNFPGIQVFGHTGAISGNTLIVADGVAVTGIDPAGGREFTLTRQAFMGRINQDDPYQIRWQPVANNPAGPLYRAAAYAQSDTGRIIFTGGSGRAYNYSGIGYDGKPAEPLAQTSIFDPASGQWQSLQARPKPSMDHRGLVPFMGALVTIGGMGEGQKIIGDVIPASGCLD